MFSPAPDCSQEQLVAHLAQSYGRHGVTLEVLPSERDAVYCVLGAAGPEGILKIANPDEGLAFLEAQNGMLSRVAPLLDSSCRVLSAIDGRAITSVTDRLGRTCWLRLLSYVPGRLLADVPYRSPQLLTALGDFLGRLDAALWDYSPAALHRQLPWDLRQGRRVVAELLPHVKQASTLAAIQRCLQCYDRFVAPIVEALPQSVIHNDAHPHNVLVDVSHDSSHDRVSGLIDFGDAVHSWTIGELAIPLAYMIVDSDDPWSLLATVVGAYHRQRSLSPEELQALYGLLLLRLCTSVVMAAEGLQRQPDNAYLQVSQAAIVRQLPGLTRHPYAWVTAVLRQACGYVAVPAAAAFPQMAIAARDQYAFPLELPAAAVGRELDLVGHELDLSVTSPALAALPWPLTEPALSAWIEDERQRRGADYAIGRYLEPRVLYQSAQFGTQAAPYERRTVHLGLDLFAPAGTPVRAVAAGTVHAVANIDLPLDYGTLVVLRHEPTDAAPFFTLYGHLATFAQEHVGVMGSSMPRLPAPPLGAAVAVGQVIGYLGEPAENGGWPPHLHLQILLDDLDDAVGFPGVGHAAWQAVWSAFSPDPRWLVPLPGADPAQGVLSPPDAALATAQLLSERQTRLGPSLRLSYRQPLHLVLGRGVRLFDAAGREYLDAYNNVPHLGHGRPEVIAAATSQMQLLSANTRYLHEKAVTFARRLTSTLPEPLRVCYFLSSASEANDLALRLARQYAAGQNARERVGAENRKIDSNVPRDVIVMEMAYHGHTTSLIDCSPYKHAGPGGHGPPDWVHSVELPDLYRGRFRDPTTAGECYAEQVAAVIAKLQAIDRFPVAWLAETCPSVGGQILLPDGYLKRVYERVRAAGGVCIADEVQTGYGRMGTDFYAFQTHGVVPDIVVLGKPIGNGFPLAAVITTPPIAAAFDNGMEFFSTFGGSTVSCAVGDCVLEITQRERLQEHALAVGEVLRQQFLRLQANFPWIGDVRGSGLFWGLDIVADPQTRQPDGARAKFIKQRLCDLGVLIGTDGSHDHVLKIRPPLPFTATDAERLVQALARACQES